MTQPWLVIIGVLMLASIVYLIVLATNRIRTTERLRCPEKNIDVEVDFATTTSASWTPGQRLDVLRCNAFADPEHVTCSRVCVYQAANRTSA